MKIQLIHRQRESSSLHFKHDNLLTHVKVLDDDGRFVKFEKITPDLLAKIKDCIITMGEREQIKCPNCNVPMLESTGTVLGVEICLFLLVGISLII